MSVKGGRMLIVEDEELIRWSISERLRIDGAAVDEAPTGAVALERLAGATYDVLLLDLRLPDMHGLAILKRALSIEPDLSVLVLTADGTVATAVEAMRMGAFDYRTKPLALEDVVVAAGRALETTRLRREVRLRRERERAGAGGAPFVHASAAMRSIATLVARLGGKDVGTVLLLGESGTGKGTVAQAIHTASARADRPLVSINCAAIPENLLESELFGHEKGAFTDARQAKRGLLEQAHGGTVFLDEIGDMPLALQAKLLQFLEDRKFRRVGGIQDIVVDARIIAATNRDLEQAVAAGRFRTDLYYRLKVVPILIPPLRTRHEDIGPLAAHFIAQFAREFGKDVADIEPAAVQALNDHPWPGNVRELRNVIERAVLLCEGGRIGLRDLLLDPPSRTARAEAGGDGSDPILLTRTGVDLRTLEQSLIRQALELARGNFGEAGRLLGLSREQVKYRAEKFGIQAGRGHGHA